MRRCSLLLSGNSRQQGMTLIEVMVAMLILAVAGTAMVRLINQSTISEVQLEQHFFAQLVAENLLVDTALNGLGRSGENQRGRKEMGNYTYPWKTATSQTSQSDFKLIEIQVELPDNSGRTHTVNGYFNATDSSK